MDRGDVGSTSRLAKQRAALKLGLVTRATTMMVAAAVTNSNCEGRMILGETHQSISSSSRKELIYIKDTVEKSWLNGGSKRHPPLGPWYREYQYPNFSSLNVSQHAHNMAATATMKCV